MSYIFSKKIKCLYCNKNFKGKTERGKKVYICSTYSNKGADYCLRNKTDEEELINIVKKHLKINNGIVIKKDEEVGEYIDKIEIGERGMEIFYIDGTKSIFNKNKIIY